MCSSDLLNEFEKIRLDSLIFKVGIENNLISINNQLNDCILKLSNLKLDSLSVYTSDNSNPWGGNLIITDCRFNSLSIRGEKVGMTIKNCSVINYYKYPRMIENENIHNLQVEDLYLFSSYRVKEKYKNIHYID